MSETKEVAGRLNAFAGITPDHPSGASYINHSARQLVREAAREIERLQSDLTRYIDIATKEATEAEGLRETLAQSDADATAARIAIERLTAERDAAQATAEYNANVADFHDKLATKWHAEFLASQATVSTLTRQLEEAREALEPFAVFAGNNTDEHGWAGSQCQRERVCDWFGPSEFRAAIRSLKQGPDDNGR